MVAPHGVAQLGRTMLTELRIRDYAVVEDLTLSLGPGLNALTGETGAGKSIIVGALSLLLGERASSSVVRAGAERATVEAAFDVSGLPGLRDRMDELGFRPEDGHLILRREVAAEGRNRAWVNGSPATATVVGELGSALVDLHGQHEHQTLLRSGEQRDILDAFAGSVERAAGVRALFEELQEVARELDRREVRRREIESRADFLRFQRDEIEGAGLQPGEDEELDAEVARHEHAEELLEGAGRAHEALYAGDGAVSDTLAGIRDLLSRLARVDASLEPAVELLNDAYHGVVEAGRQMADYADTVDHDAGRLQEVRQRLDLLFRLKRKYGPELADVLEQGQRVREELEELEESDHDLQALRNRMEEVRGRLRDEAASLSEVRREAAGTLAAQVEGLLPELGMPGARFEVRLEPLAEVSAGGDETVRFLVAANAGFEPEPLSRVASGGELSRVMLALKSILAAEDQVPVLVFDEIDAGIGGVVATAVARTLHDVAREHQVFVVTHLPQLASRAASHLLVEKGRSGERASTTVRSLDGEERVEEVARMLGGDPESSTSRDHARELLGTC